MEWLFHLDASLLLWVQENLRVSWLTPFFKQITKLGNVGWFWIFSDSNTFADPKAEENRSHVCGILSRFSSGQQSVFKKCRGKNKTI